MTALSGLYRQRRECLTQLLHDVDETQAATLVPSTPEWTIKDVIAHLSGLTDDWVNERSEGYGTEAWTAAQVEPRRPLTLEELLAEWSRISPEFEARMDDPTARWVPEFAPYLAVADVTIHEHDIRGALGRPGERDSAGVQLGMKTYVTGVRQRHSGSGLGPMLIRETDGRDWPVGTGEPIVTVSAPRFELFRAMAGRRSRAQAVAFDWDGDPEPFVDLFLAPGFAWATEELDH
jgi:uncharacterized protein (TIGR03083 family)